VRKQQPTVGTFQKVGECLYRYSSNGVYYARIKSAGKEIRPSLEPMDPTLARAKFAEASQGAKPN
jgi:hypothetical protein